MRIFFTFLILHHHRRSFRRKPKLNFLFLYHIQRIDQKSRITLDSLENVSTNELSQQILDFINEHPDKREKLIDYVFNVKLLNNQTKDRSEEKYQQSLIDAVTDYSMILETAEEFSNNGIVTKKVADRWQSESIPAEDDFELYNAKLKIAELNRRYFEATVELKEAADDQNILVPLDLIFGPPKAFDIAINVVTGAVSAVFSNAEEDRKIMQESNSALYNICETLWIDMQHYTDEATIREYYRSRVPRYLFAYDIEEDYFPQSSDEVYISWRNGSIPRDALQKLYQDLSGDWKSLFTGQTIHLEDNYENENKVATYPKMNAVHFCGKNAIFAECDYRGADFGKAGKTAEIFVTTAYLLDNDGTRKKVVIMYADYKLAPQYVNGSNPENVSDSWKYVQNYRVYKIGSAEDVFIKM